MSRFFRPFTFTLAGFFLFLIIPSLVSAQPAVSPALVTPHNGVVTYDDRATFNADAPGLPVEDWEEGHVSGPFVFCNPPLNSSSNDACFLPGEILPGLEFQDAPLGGGSQHVGLGAAGLFSMPSKFVYANVSADTTNLFFTPTVTAVGVDLSSNGAGNTIFISVYDANDSLIITDTSTVGVLGSLTFWGVISSIPIERVNINILNGEFVDNVAFGGALPPITPTPSPTSTSTPTATATATATPTATNTPSATPTNTPSPTPEPPTAVSIDTMTATPFVPMMEIGMGLGFIVLLGLVRGFKQK